MEPWHFDSNSETADGWLGGLITLGILLVIITIHSIVEWVKKCIK